ncbi:MAG: hypothetical protein PHR28_04915 [candidate division Zixibacteria bacterium]|jgi:hypothetical protein|nr:hypothetical protein [candidate division Zixibacteria bacterium]
MRLPKTVRYSEEQRRLIEYLRAGALKGKTYYKSKHIASEIGMTPRSVGSNILYLAKTCKELVIQRWSYSNSTTWKVTLPDAA